MSDIVPELLKQIQEDFKSGFDKSESIAGLVKKITEGTATYIEADEYALEVGEILAEAFKKNISADILPDGKMFYNIAKRILEPTLQNNYNLITEITKQIQEKINKNAGIGIKAIKPELNKERVDGLVDAVSSAERYDAVMRILDEPVKNFSQSIVMDSIKTNADFQYKSGLGPSIQRISMGKCCKWCQALVGTYDYPDVPRDVYRRHDYCRCKVDYVKGKIRENIHNDNTGERRYVQDEYGTYVKSKAERIKYAEKMNATEKERKEAARQKRIETWKKKAEEQSKVVENNAKHDTIELRKEIGIRSLPVSLSEAPKRLASFTPESLKRKLEKEGFEVKPLKKGSLKDVPFEDGGGYKVNFGGDGILQYHPEKNSHHDGAYYKISTGEGGTKRYELDGTEKEY